MCYGYHIWSKEALMQAENDDDLDGGQRSSEVKWGKLCAMATIFGQKKCWCKLRMMMTLMEVKGHQRSNGVNYVLWLPYFVKEVLMQTENDDDLYGGQRSSEVKCGKLCDMATIFGQKNHWCKLGMMTTFMEVKANRGQIQWIIFVLPLWYLVSRWGLGSKVPRQNINHGSMVNHGQPWLNHGWQWLTKLQPWWEPCFQPWLAKPWSTMVNHGSTMVGHGWPCLIYCN